jgi:RNA polymerase sigma factor (sigma-70 family)
MSFPETRPTLISRLAIGGSEADWQHFLHDYWGPIVRFAGQVERLPPDQAEDAAAEVFMQLVRTPLLERWQKQPTGKLRSFLCGVVRNQLANRRRVEQGRNRLRAEMVASGGDYGAIVGSMEPTVGDLDTFYKAWVDELLAQSMRDLLAELQAEGRGDYFRALYGRICEEMSAVAIGEALGVPAATIENYLRVGKARLAAKLRDLVREQVVRYCSPENVAEQFEKEWAELAHFLERHGGLDAAIRVEAARANSLASPPDQSPSCLALKTRLRESVRMSPD